MRNQFKLNLQMAEVKKQTDFTISQMQNQIIYY